MKIVVIILTILTLTTGAWAGGNEPVSSIPVAGSSFTSQLQSYLRGEWPALYVKTQGGVPFVRSGGLHATAASCTASGIALDAVTSSGNRITADGAGGSVAINYSAANIAANCANPGSDVCWVVGSSQGQDWSVLGGRTVVSMPTLPASAFNRVGTSNYYADCTSASQPALPSDSVLLMKVTITNGAITAVQDLRQPASYARAGVYDITDPLYGAVPDGSTDAKTAITTALTARPDEAITVHVPTGTFVVSGNVFVPRSNVTLKGQGAGSIIKAKSGFTNTSNTGLVEFGYSPSTGNVSISNITIRDMTFDGNSLAKSLGVRNCTTCLITHIQALNAGTSSGAIFTMDSTDLIVSDSYVSGAIGTSGDGIYSGGNTRARIVHNAVYNFTRLGIVSEAGRLGAKSADVYIAGNTVRHGHDATNPEHNGAIWVENTCGAVITGNVGSDLTNTPGAAYSVGIALSNGSAGECQWDVTDNQMSGAERGMVIQPDATDRVRVDGFAVSRGTLTDYNYGISISQGHDISLRHIMLGPNNFTGGSKSGIVFDSTGNATTIHTLTIADSVSDVTSAYATNAATFLLYNIGGAITYLNLHNLQYWQVLMGSAPARVKISDSHLTFDTASGLSAMYTFQASTDFFMTNSRLTHVGAGTNEKVMKPLAGTHYRFQNVEFDTFVSNYDDASAAISFMSFDGCLFGDGVQMSVGANLTLQVANSLFYNNPAWGAIHGNQRALTFNLAVSNSQFINGTAANTPIVQGTNAPTSTKLLGNTFGTTLQTTVTTAVETTSQGVLFANLGTRANGSMVFCGDCGIGADPCAGAGSGALAFRANGRWYCP